MLFSLNRKRRKSNYLMIMNQKATLLVKTNEDAFFI